MIAAGVVAVLVVLVLVPRLFRRGDSEAVKSAIVFLQLNQQQKAIDALANDKSARASWLRALALENQRDMGAARDQIKAAREREPRNRTYRGLELRLQLEERPPKMEAADELLALREEDRTSAALALFAFYAHSAKSVFDGAMKKEESAKTHAAEARSALNSAVALNADVPELQRELLTAALKFGLADQVDVLSEKLVNMAPNDPALLRDRISVLMLMRRFDDAADAAEQLYAVNKGSENAALILSQALSQSTETEAHEERLESLQKAHPQSLTLIVHRAVYLTRAKRIRAAAEQFDAELAQRKKPEERFALLDALMTVVLEGGDAELAEEKLNQYRAQIRDPLLITYFEGRILFLKKDYKGALEKLNEVLKTQKQAVGTDRVIAGNALRWIRIVLQDAQASEALQKASDELERKITGDDAAEAEIPEKQ